MVEKKKTQQQNTDIFSGPVNKEVLALYVRVYSTNQRQGTVRTKTRGDVSGGGAKPWRQKGTGNARQGSRRAPHWVHGGIAHGPKPKDWTLKLTARTKKLALKSALALKKEQEGITIIDVLEVPNGKTSEMQAAISKLNLTGNILLVTPKSDLNLYKAGRNLSNLLIASAYTVNAYDILWANNVVIVKDALEKLEERL